VEEKLIRNVIFDLGNVLLTYDPLNYLRGIYDENKAEVLYKCIFASGEWLDLDRGSMDYPEAVEIISRKNPELRDCIKSVFDSWPRLLSPIHGSVEILKRLKKKGFGVYLLSNFHKQAYNEVFNKYGFLQLFDGIVISSDILMIKPEKEIFLHTCSKYGLEPEESVFIDDTAMNVAAARELGFTAIQFNNPEQLFKDLRKIIDTGLEV
jgi:epoxide hydrolase-like predicted phosphatase